MSFFKFTPDLMSKNELNSIFVGRQSLLNDVKLKIENAVEKQLSVHILFVGQRGIGKTHFLLTLYHYFKDNKKALPIRLSEEEYSVTNLENFFQRILDEIPVEYDHENIIDNAILIFKKFKSEGKTPIVFVDNLQMLFEQIEDDLPKLRAILQEHNPFFIVGSALTVFHSISSHDEPFYNFLDVIFLKGLSVENISELIKKRLNQSNKLEILKSIPNFEERIKGIHVLTGGNPRLVHALCELIIQKNSLDEIESNLLSLLDQLTPYYQARMESLPIEKRKIVDSIALEIGPISPSVLAKKINMKTNAVITQLRRLENDGLVESIKFREKKSTKYQISERLYRIWREMRSPIGIKKISLFINFLKIWYTREELFDEYQRFSQDFYKFFNFSKSDAKRSLTCLCYVAETLGDWKILDFENIVEKLLVMEDYEKIEEEIKNVKKKYSTINNPIIKSAIKLGILISELAILEKNHENTTEKLEEISQEESKLVQQSSRNDESDTMNNFWLHELFHKSGTFYYKRKKYDEAEKFIDLSLKYQSDCASALTEKARTHIARGNYHEGIKILEQISIDTPIGYNLDTDILILKIGSHVSTKKFDVAVNLAEKLIEYPDFSSSRLISCFIGTDIQLLDKVVCKLLKKVKEYELSQKKYFVHDLVEGLFHYLGHAILEEKNQEKIEHCLNHLDNSLKLYPTLNILDPFMVCLVELSTNKKYDAISSIISKLHNVLDSAKLAEIEPIRVALDYIRTEQTDVLENLHKEIRDLTLNIIKTIAPHLQIPKKVYDSL